MGKRLVLFVAGGAPAIGLIVWIWFVPGSPTEPTEATTAPGRLDRIPLPDSIWNVADRPTLPGLAADDYNKSVVEYLNLRRRNGYLASPSERASLVAAMARGASRSVDRGAGKRRMCYLATYVPPDQAVRLTHQELASDRAPTSAGPPQSAGLPRPTGLPHLNAFDVMADAALLQARQYENAGKSSDAERLCKAVLVLGYHVAQDRGRLRGLQLGLDIQQRATRRLAEFYRRRKKAKPLAAAATLLEDLGRTIKAVNTKAEQTLLRRDENGLPNVGDLRNLAANDADPTWRVEAIRQLGPCLASLSKDGGGPDHQAVSELLSDCRGNADPFVKAAAERALGAADKNTRPSD